MSTLSENLRSDARRAHSAGLQGEHSLDVPAQSHQIPFACDVFQSSQQGLTIAHHRFDDAKHRLRGLLAQGVEFASPRCPQAIRSRPRLHAARCGSRPPQSLQRQNNQELRHLGRRALRRPTRSASAPTHPSRFARSNTADRSDHDEYSTQPVELFLANDDDPNRDSDSTNTDARNREF